MLQTGVTNEEKEGVRAGRYAGNVKMTIAINNLGSLPSAQRASDRGNFVDDIVHMPATISCVLEASKATLEAMLTYGPMYQWPDRTPDNDEVVFEQWESPRVAGPSPGSRVPIHRWYHSTPWDPARTPHGPMVFARSTMVRQVQTLCKDMVKFGKEFSRVLVVSVTMKDTDQDIVVCVFHLNNDTAKSVTHRAAFFAWLAPVLVEKKVRFLLGDANMAMYAVGHYMDEHHIQCHLVAKHLEFDREDDMGITYDTCGIWVLGPVHRDGLRMRSYRWRRRGRGACERTRRRARERCRRRRRGECTRRRARERARARTRASHAEGRVL